MSHVYYAQTNHARMNNTQASNVQTAGTQTIEGQAPRGKTPRGQVSRSSTDNRRTIAGPILNDRTGGANALAGSASQGSAFAYVARPLSAVETPLRGAGVAVHAPRFAARPSPASGDSLPAMRTGWSRAAALGLKTSQ